MKYLQVSSRTIASTLLVCSSVLCVAISQRQPETNWKTDPAWNQGKAEWTLYEATRTIYGKQRNYEAIIFTNKQFMNPGSGTKAADWRTKENIEVFKSNISEVIPTENYDYRMLTTSFVRTDNLQPFKVVSSSQEDCGSSYREFITKGNRIEVDQFCYFPDTGHTKESIDTSKGIAFHNALSLTLRDFPYGAIFIKQPELNLVPDQRKNQQTKVTPENATITYIGEETISVPYGKLKAHHLRIDHAEDGGATESHFWFAADSKLLNVMVQYEGPYGITYKLKKHGWWAYWDRNAKRPD